MRNVWKARPLRPVLIDSWPFFFVEERTQLGGDRVSTPE